MVIVALVLAWLAVALVLALFLGRSLAVAEKSDRWRHGQREVRDPRKLTPITLAPAPAAAEGSRRAA